MDPEAFYTKQNCIGRSPTVRDNNSRIDVIGRWRKLWQGVQGARFSRSQELVPVADTISTVLTKEPVSR